MTTDTGRQYAYRLEEIDLDDVGHSSLREAIAEVLEIETSHYSREGNYPARDARIQAYRVEVYTDDGTREEAEAAEALYIPSLLRLGCAWGADDTWANVDDLESGIDMWLNDPDEWEARN